MSDVSKTNDLIAEAQQEASIQDKLGDGFSEGSEERAFYYEHRDRYGRLADALEAATRERDAALACIAEAAKLHYRDTPSVGGDWCPEDHHKWPCPTAVALGLNEGEEK